jgi:REP element-mobilizing transposase RayT
MFTPNFVKISQLVKKFIWGTCTMHTQHSNLKVIHFPSANKQSREDGNTATPSYFIRVQKQAHTQTLQHISLYLSGSVQWQDHAIPPTYRQLVESLQG